MDKVIVMKSTNSLLKPLAKYLYTNIGSATSWTSQSNVVTVQFTVYIVHPIDVEGQTIDHVDLEVNITTYSNKIRIELFEKTPLERTLAFYVYTPENVQDFKYMKTDILKKIKKAVTKYYEGIEDTI